MKVQDQEVTFNVFKAMKFPSDEKEEECFRIDVVDSIIQDTDTIPMDKLEACITNMTDNELDAEILEYINYLDKPFHFKSTTPVENLDLPKKDRIKPSIEEPPQLELKLLPNHLRYAFLGNSSELPVIISSSLTLEHEEKLLRVLREHKKAIGWTIADIRDISPSFCMHKILMNDEYKPTVEHQQRLNPIMKEVVKKEIIKWLDVGIIYLISDST